MCFSAPTVGWERRKEGMNDPDCTLIRGRGERIESKQRREESGNRIATTTATTTICYNIPNIPPFLSRYAIAMMMMTMTITRSANTVGPRQPSNAPVNPYSTILTPDV